MKTGMQHVNRLLQDSQCVLKWKELPGEQELDKTSADLVTQLVFSLSNPMYLSERCVLAIPCTCLKDVYLQPHALAMKRRTSIFSLVEILCCCVNP